MSAQGKKKDKSFITLLVLIIVCACLMVAAVTTLGIGMSKGDIGENPGENSETVVGTKWSSGSGAPAANSGVTGDFYLDTATGKIYKKTANGWELQITIPVASAVTPFINDNGYWQVGDTVYDGATAGGAITEALIPQIRDDGYWYINGVKQEQYGRAWHDFIIDENGHIIMDSTQDLGAIAPHIGDSDNGEKDGYWYIGDVCLGLKASVDLSVEGGKLCIDGVPVPSVTAVDGYTPYINEAGNWQIGDNDTGIPARGQDGVNGATPELSGGNWYLNGELIGPATGANGNAWHTGSGRPISDAKDTDTDTFLVTFPVAEGDFFLNTATGDVYRYLNGEWGLLCSISFRLVGNEWTINGRHTEIFCPQWYVDAGDPNHYFRGYKGDFYFDTQTGNIYINVSEEGDIGTDLKGSKWKSVVSLATGNWLTGEGTPEVVLNGVHPLKGNLYLDLLSGQMYEYDGDKWVRLEGFNLKGGQGERANHLFVGKGAPTATEPEGALSGDYYLDTQSGIIYRAKSVKDGGVETIVWERSSVSRDWISGTGDPKDNTALTATAVDGDIYYDTEKNSLWQYSEKLGKWSLLGRLAGATKWFHGSYDPAKYQGVSETDISSWSDNEKDDYYNFTALTSDAIEGDFYLQTFSAFSTRGGIVIYVYQGGIWVKIADVTGTVSSTEFNIPTLDVLREFRNSITGTTNYSGQEIKLTGIVTMPNGTFAPIGGTTAFEGTFNGANEALNDEGLYIQNVNGTLFGNLGDGAKIENLYLKGNLDASLATFFNEDATDTEHTHNFNSLLKDNYGLVQEISGSNVTISNVKLELSNAQGTVTVTWGKVAEGTGIGEVTVEVKGEGEGKDYKLVIGQDTNAADEGPATVDNRGLLDLGAASFTFTHVKFAGRSYIDVSNAKSLTLIDCEAQVAPVKAADRNDNGTLIAENNHQSEVAAFIVNKADAEGSLKLTIKDTTILAAQSSSKDKAEDNNANSAAIYLTMEVGDVELTGNTFGAADGRYTEKAVVLGDVAEAAELTLSGNTVYGAQSGTAEFVAFALTSDAQYTAKFNKNKVNVTGEKVSFLSVEGSGSAQVYLEGKENTLTGADDLFHSVKVADAAIDFVAFNAEYKVTEVEGSEPTVGTKLYSGFVYFGTFFGEDKGLTNYNALTNVEEGDTLKVIDIHYDEVEAFYKKATGTTAFTTYYINNVTGLGYFRTSVNGVAAASGVTAVEAKDYSGKTVILAEETEEPYDLSTWTSIGTGTTSDTAFSGTFDGSDNTITGLKVALFGNLGANATVKNLTIDGAVVEGTKNVSALASVATGNVTIESVHITNSTITLNAPAPAVASVDDAHTVGFFVGATASDVTVTLKGVSVTKAQQPADSTLINNYAYSNDGVAVETKNVLVYNYGLVGYTEGSSVTVKYGLVATTTSTYPYINIKLSAAEDLVLTATWGTESDPTVIYTVNTALGLNNISKMVALDHSFENETVVLGQNIDMSKETKWTPIGKEDNPFKGIFAGGLETIEKATNGGEDKVVAPTNIYGITGLTGALFGNLEGTVQYLNLDQTLTAKGAVATTATGATIKNVVIEATWDKPTEGEAVKASDFAAAPFNIIVGTADITNTTLNAKLDKLIVVAQIVVDEKNNKSVAVTFTGTKTGDAYDTVIEGEQFILKGITGATAAFTFENIKFTGNSYIYVGNAKDGAINELTVTNCYADVNPSLYNNYAEETADNDKIKHAAFIIGDATNMADGSVVTKFTITDNVIISGQSKTGETVNDAKSLAIFTWVGFADGTTISGNVFGSAERPYTSAVIKTLGFTYANWSKVTISENTFYQTYGQGTTLLEAVDLAPIAVHSDIYYNVWLKKNTQIISTAENATAGNITLVEVHNHLNKDVDNVSEKIYAVHGRVFITNDNTVTVDGKPVTIDYEFVTKSLLDTTYDFVGYGVTVNDDGKITGGNFILGSGTGIASAKELANELKGYVATGSESNVHIVLREGIGSNLSDLLNDDENTYYIYSSEGFKSFMALVNEGYGFSGKTIKLSSDLATELGGNQIDLKKFATKSGEEGHETYTWTPLGATASRVFKGTFDGDAGDNTHWVIDASGVTFGGTDNVGFFAAVAGTVKNFDFRNFEIEATAEGATTLGSVGAVAGTLTSGSLENINLSDITFSGELTTVGALVGTMEGGTVTGIDVNGVTLSGATVGGVIGEMKGGTLKGVAVGSGDASTVNTISTTDETTGAVGGVVGKVSVTSDNVTIGGSTMNDLVIVLRNVTVIAASKAQDTIGGIIGSVDAASATVTVDGAYFVGKLSYTVGESESVTFKAYNNYGLVGGETSVTITASLLHIVYATGFELDARWGDEDVTAEYQITSTDKSADGLTYFASVVNGGEEVDGFSFENETVHLMGDIVMPTGDDVPTWTPIGTTTNPFKGTFTGKYTDNSKPAAHSITGLTVNVHGTHNTDGVCEGGKDYAGLFGFTGGTASINYVEIVNANIKANEYAGALVGRFNGNGTIDHVTVTNSQVRAHHFVGGIAGWTDGSIKNSTVDGLVAVAIPNAFVDTDTQTKFDNGDDLGGLVGYVGRTGAHRFTDNTVDHATLTGYRDIGGLVGTDDATTATTYTGNKVDNTVITVSQVLRLADHTGDNEEFYANYPEQVDYNYVDSKKPQHADWLVGRFTREGATIGDENTRGDVTVNLFTKDPYGFILDNGVWHITDVAGFKQFANLVTSGEENDKYQAHFEGATVSLEVDIELTADAATVFAPIKGFAGTFLGNGHSITFGDNVTIQGTGNVGLFDELNTGAKVENLVIANATVKGDTSVGVLAGSLNGATVNDITVNGATVTSENGVAGGLIGTITTTSGTISNITLTGVNVTGKTASAAFATFTGSGTLTVNKFNFSGTLVADEGVTPSMLEGENVTFTNSRVVITDAANTDVANGFFYGANAGEKGTQNHAYFVEDIKGKEGLGLKAFGDSITDKSYAGETVYLLSNITIKDAWTAPTATFNGTFDGLGHTITATAETLFGVVGTTDTKATITDLALDGLALATNLNNAEITSVDVTIKTSGIGKALFGLAGTASETEDAVVVKSSSITVECDSYNAKFAWDGNGTVKAAAISTSNNTAFIIKDAAGLGYLATVVNGGIDFSGLTVEIVEKTTIELDANTAWTPIGRIVKETTQNRWIDEANSIAFKGTFNGKGATIKGLKIDGLATDGKFGYGLFGYVKGGTIQNLTIEGANINVAVENGDYAGILAGALDGTSLSGITIKGTEVDAFHYVGAVAGYAKGVTITTGTTDSYTITVENVTVTGTDDVAGVFGIVEGTCSVAAKLTGMSVGLNNSGDGVLADVGAAVGFVLANSTVTIDVTYEGHLEFVSTNTYHGMVGSVSSTNANVTIKEGSSVTLLVSGFDATAYKTVHTWTADNTASTEVKIGNEAGLNYFRGQVDDDNDYHDVTVTLTEVNYDLGTIEAIAAEKAFKGTLQGESGKTVTLTYTLNATAQTDGLGLFGSVNGATVKDLTLEVIINATAAGAKWDTIGAIAGKGTGTLITSNLSGEVTINVSDAVAEENLPVNNGLAGTGVPVTESGNDIEVIWKGTGWDEIKINNKVVHLANVNNFSLFTTLVNNGKDFDDMTVVLDNDITLNGVSGTPIGFKEEHPFKGTFDGNHKTISGFTADVKTNERSGGLFGYLDGATVKDLTLDNITVKGYASVGAVAGTATNSNITGVTVTNFNLSGTVAGGIVGKNTDTTITDCFVNGQPATASISALGRRNAPRAAGESVISAVTHAGGIVGQYTGESGASFKGLVVENVNIQVTGTAEGAKAAAVGGIFGSIVEGGGAISLSDIEILNANLIYPDGAADVKFGALAGTPTTVSDVEVATQGVKSFAEGATDEAKEVKPTNGSTLEVYENGNKIYSGLLVAKKEGGSVTFYEITSVEGFKSFRDLVNGGTIATAGVAVRLATDIDLAGETWTPIGIDAHRFMGTFDGRNHTISNIKVAGSKYVGLFGVVGENVVNPTECAIKNLVIAGVNTVTVNGTTYSDRNDSGLLVGYGANVAFSNILVAADAKVTVTGVGELYTGNVVGGLVGASQSCTYDNIQAKCTIRVDDKGGVAVGGIIGLSMHDVLTNFDITNAWVDGTFAVGGLIGNTFGTESLTNVHVGGNVYMNYWWYYTNLNASEYYKMIGGLVGSAELDQAGDVLTIENSSFNGSLVRANAYSAGGELKLYTLPNLLNNGLVGRERNGAKEVSVTIKSTSFTVMTASSAITENGFVSLYGTIGDELNGEYNETGALVTE